MAWASSPPTLFSVAPARPRPPSAALERRLARIGAKIFRGPGPHKRYASSGISGARSSSLTPYASLAGVGWGNAFQEILLNAHLAYRLNRACVPFFRGPAMLCTAHCPLPFQARLRQLYLERRWLRVHRLQREAHPLSDSALCSDQR